MKVIKDGRAQIGWTQEVLCTGSGNGGGGCGALLLVEQPDVYLTYQYHYDERDVFHTFRCSQCGVETDFPAKTDYPQHVNFPDRVAWLKLNAK